jgi:transcription initiation factor IIF auxiliary subunit
MASKKKITTRRTKGKARSQSKKVLRVSASGSPKKRPQAGASARKKTLAIKSTRPEQVTSLVVKQRSVYQGNQWWNWSVWIDAPEKHLDQIQYVEYTLHPTFAERVRRVTDRSTRFCLDSAGWGEFMIGVKIQGRDGRSFKRQHWLTLDYPQETSKPSRPEPNKRKERPTVYISGSVSDINFTTVLAKSLEVQGFEVLKKEDVSSELPWDRGMTVLIEQADLVVVLISGSLTTWGIREIDAALSRKIPIVPVVIGPVTLPENLQAFRAISLKDVSDPVKIAPHVSMQIKEAIHR